MSQHHQGYQQGQDVHRDIRHYMHHVIPNTSSTLTHGTGHAATNGPSSSFQTPGQAVSLSPYTPPVGDQSRVPSFFSSNQHASVAAVPKSLEPRPMGHGQSKPAPPLLSQSLTSVIDPVLDAGLLTTRGMSVAGGKLKRAFGAKRKESNDPYLLAPKETSVEAIIGVSRSISSRPTEYAPNSIHSSVMSAPTPYPPIQACGRSYLFAEFRLKPLSLFLRFLTNTPSRCPRARHHCHSHLPHFLDPQRVLRGNTRNLPYLTLRLETVALSLILLSTPEYHLPSIS